MRPVDHARPETSGPGPPASTGPAALWERQAAHWALLGRPLRPSGEDVAWVQESIDEQGAVHGGAPTVLILGVTPELVDRRWPDGATVLATDLSMVMIRAVGPVAGGSIGRVSASRADWLNLPLDGGCCDLVLGDGSFANVPGAHAIGLAESVRRVLGPEGLLTTRMFVRPDDPEAPDHVWNQLLDGRIGSFAAFKLPLLMALCRDDGDVRVTDGWEYFEARGPDIDALAGHLGWAPETIRTIEAYRDQPTVYWFPTMAQLRALVSREFDERACHHPAYELGDRCPTFALG